MNKQYDERYFQRWYHDPDSEQDLQHELQRKVALALAVSEYYLGRPVESVLDVGCGEGSWRAPLLALRPGLDYRGVDASEYAVARYGAERNLHWVSFGQLAEVRFGPPVDLLVCADVMYYLSSRELRRGLSGFAELCDGVAFMEVCCAEDDVAGDDEEYHPRSARWYRKTFREFGWTACGSHCYLSPTLAPDAMALEISR
ncbi:MAG: class I SAM-dependent methyltransferase [Wenzhouxiangellaceae bacterium]